MVMEGETPSKERRAKVATGFEEMTEKEPTRLERRRYLEGA